MHKRLTGFFNRLVFSDDLHIDVRVFNMICLAGFVATVLSLLGHFVEHSSAPIWIIKSVMLVGIVAFIYLTNHKGMFNLCRWLAVIGFCDIIFPLIFILNGGFEGGTATYFVLSFVVIVLLLKGAPRLLITGLTLVIIGGCYFVNLAAPDFVHHLTYEQRFIDSMLTFVITAAFISIVVIVQNKMSLLERARMEAAARAKGDFLAQMSHEMRTPMNAILGMAGIARRACDDDTRADSIAKIEGASKHLLGVINDILDMSKIEAGKLELATADFDFHKMVDTVVTLGNYSIASKMQKFKCEVDAQIPHRLRGDSQRLAQVLTNLLSNASKFTGEGGRISLEIACVSADDSSATISMSVTDTGIGIGAEQLGRLFKPFEQADNSASRVYGGTGLGLVISQRIVNAMGSNIEVRSTPGEGSCFSFTVTLARASKGSEAAGSKTTAAAANAAAADAADADASGTAPSPSQLPAHPHASSEDDIAEVDLHGRVILLAEDLTINSEIAMALLEPTGATIELATNGQEALEMFSANPGRYTLILMDIQMPLMDGLEATRAIRAIGSPEALSVPILAMTANVFKEDVERSLEAGMNDHIGKPIDIAELFGKLARHLGQSAMP